MSWAGKGQPDLQRLPPGVAWRLLWLGPGRCERSWVFWGRRARARPCQAPSLQTLCLRRRAGVAAPFPHTSSLLDCAGCPHSGRDSAEGSWVGPRSYSPNEHFRAWRSLGLRMGLHADPSPPGLPYDRQGQFRAAPAPKPCPPATRPEGRAEKGLASPLPGCSAAPSGVGPCSSARSEDEPCRAQAARCPARDCPRPLLSQRAGSRRTEGERAFGPPGRLHGASCVFLFDDRNNLEVGASSCVLRREGASSRGEGPCTPDRRRSWE